MIQINLLGVPKPKKGKRSAAAASMPGEGPNPIILIGITALIAIVVLGFMYVKVVNEKSTIEANMKKAEIEAQQLADAKAKADQMEAQSKLLDQRVKVIEDLRAKRSGPVELLTMIGDTVNNTDGVWLLTMKDDGSKIDLNGSALSVQQVANLMKNLQGTGYFKSIELKETAQDDQVKDMQQFNFTLVCEKADKTQPGSTAAPASADKKM